MLQELLGYSLVCLNLNFLNCVSVCACALFFKECIFIHWGLSFIWGKSSVLVPVITCVYMHWLLPSTRTTHHTSCRVTTESPLAHALWRKRFFYDPVQPRQTVLTLTQSFTAWFVSNTQTWPKIQCMVMWTSMWGPGVIIWVSVLKLSHRVCHMGECVKAVTSCVCRYCLPFLWKSKQKQRNTAIERRLHEDFITHGVILMFVTKNKVFYHVKPSCKPGLLAFCN